MKLCCSEHHCYIVKCPFTDRLPLPVHQFRTSSGKCKPYLGIFHHDSSWWSTLWAGSVWWGRSHTWGRWTSLEWRCPPGRCKLWERDQEWRWRREEGERRQWDVSKSFFQLRGISCTNCKRLHSAPLWIDTLQKRKVSLTHYRCSSHYQKNPIFKGFTNDITSQCPVTVFSQLTSDSNGTYDAMF